MKALYGFLTLIVIAFIFVLTASQLYPVKTIPSPPWSAWHQTTTPGNLSHQIQIDWVAATDTTITFGDGSWDMDYIWLFTDGGACSIRAIITTARLDADAAIDTSFFELSALGTYGPIVEQWSGIRIKSAGGSGTFTGRAVGHTD